MGSSLLGDSGLWTLADSVPVMLWFAGPDSRCTFCNKAWLTFRGRPLREELQNGWLDGIHPDDKASCVDMLRAAFAGTGSCHVEFRLRRHDGQYRSMLFQAAPWHDNETFVGYVGSAVDITDRATRADPPRDSETPEHRLRQSQKMEVIGRLAGGVAHDFNNLLTIISGYSDMALDQLSDDDPIKELVYEIRNAGERAASLTRQLLAFSRQQRLETKVLDVNTILSSNESLLRRLLGEDIEFTTALAPDLYPVVAEQNQLEQVFFNLAVNAREAMPQGGKLTIETKNVQLDASYRVTYPEVRPGHYVMFAVSDTGCGISDQVKSQMFKPFFTTKKDEEGTGLGLAMISNFVKQTEGHISVYSEPGYGATFKIYLPRANAPAEATTPELTSSPAMTGHETILLVEDDDAVRTLTLVILQSYGYNVLEARNGADAIRVAEKFSGEIDLLLSDVVLPDYGGRQIAEKLASKRPSMKVLYVSGYTDEAVVRHGVLGKEDNFLQKPFMPNGLLQKVRDALDA